MKKLFARALFIPSLIYNVLLGRILKIRPWWSDVDERVIIGALPFASDAKRLADLGVKGVVNTCEEYPGPTDVYDANGMEQLRVPTVDFQPPTLEHLEESVAFIHKHADAGDKVYVHCKAGRGRSATVVICWLIDTQGMTPKEAQDFLIGKRSHVNTHLAERTVVKEFYQARHGESQAVST